MKAIGGYFELEFSKREEYHKDAVKLNTGRNALEMILLNRNLSKLYIPYFTCDAILEPLEKLKVSYEFYNIDQALEPVFDFGKVLSNEGFLYTNYFGLKDGFIENLKSGCKNLIIDNAHSFFSKPIPGVDTFYSPRKFFGVPDGGYVYSDNLKISHFLQDSSNKRFEHLLVRTEAEPEEGYIFFTEVEKSLSHQPIKWMSSLTSSVLASIDYNEISKIRLENFNFFHEKLSKLNELKIDWWDGLQIPMVYPFLFNNTSLRERLIRNRIFIAKYWPNVKEWSKNLGLESYLSEHLLPLPIDQRYGKEDLMRIINILNEE